MYRVNTVRKEINRKHWTGGDKAKKRERVNSDGGLNRAGVDA
jgi:hypothetical protein